MVLSEVINASSPSMLAAHGHKGPDQSELEAFRRLIERATVTGWLTRRDEDVILASLVKTSRYARQKCELFRQLQERVWQAELYLEP
jgi:hypothetical protein